MNRKTLLIKEEKQRVKGKMFYFSQNKYFTTDINEKIKSFFEVPTIYKLFYEIKDFNNPNYGFKCIIEDFLNVTSNIITSNTLKVNISTIIFYYYYESKCENIIIDDLTFSSNNMILEDFLKSLNKTIFLKLKSTYNTTHFNKYLVYFKEINKLNNIYISKDLQTLYIFEEECLSDLSIDNQEIINIIDKLPAITYDNKNIYLNNNLLYQHSTLIKNGNNYKSKNKIQLFQFNNLFEITTKLHPANTNFTLTDENNWYYLYTSLYNGEDIVQLIYILPEIIELYNKLFLNYKTPFKFEIVKITGGQKNKKNY